MSGGTSGLGACSSQASGPTIIVEESFLGGGPTARQRVVPRQVRKLLGGAVPRRLLRKLLKLGPTARKQVVPR